MIEIKNVSKKFNGYNALDNVSFNIEEGTIHGIIGENAAGKTTLIRCMAGIYKPDIGDVTYNGVKVYDNPAVKQHIGYVADSNQYFGTYTVKKMAEFFQGMYETFSMARFSELNELFGLPYEQRVSQLSKGQQMRLSLILNIAIAPKYLLLDEPTSGLGTIARLQLFDVLIDEVENRGTTIVISTHHLGELEKLCDRMSILQQGRLIYDADLDAIKAKVKKIQAVFKNPPGELNLPSIVQSGHVGSIYYFITDNFSNELLYALKANNAVMTEEVELSLEEIFLYINKPAKGVLE